MSNGETRTDPSLQIRECRADETDRILTIINAAAEAYRGVIPADRWHEPYMSRSELESELDAGVSFICCEADGAPIAVMGMQTVRNVDLIRHAYTLPRRQGRGIGSVLLSDLRARTRRPMLIGTWAAAGWAIGFYQRHGFELQSDEVKALLLRAYWTIPERQIETSVVLAASALTPEQAAKLIEDGR